MSLRSGLKLAAVALAASTLFAACSSAAPATSTSGTASAPSAGMKKIGVTFPILDQFLQKVADGITAEAKAKGADVNIVAADEQTDKQLGQVENFISQKVDAIIVIAVDTDAAGPMTQAAATAGIPLVYVNRRPADLPETVPYVGSDSLVSGTLEMTELAKLAGGRGNVVILQGDPANEAAQLRTKGCKDVVAANPGMKVIKEQAGNWKRTEGLDIMENWLQSGDKIDVVCANNDEMALGAIEAIKKAGKLDSIFVGGVDATADALAAMKSGELEVTVFQDAKGQGAGGVDAALKLAAKETVPAYVDVPYVLVTKDNLAEFEGK
ncbi:MAG: sugar ABC transporter substrate-binding protein [Micropruina sp.]